MGAHLRPLRADRQQGARQCLLFSWALSCARATRPFRCFERVAMAASPSSHPSALGSPRALPLVFQVILRGGFRRSLMVGLPTWKQRLRGPRPAVRGSASGSSRLRAAQRHDVLLRMHDVLDLRRQSLISERHLRAELVAVVDAAHPADHVSEASLGVISRDAGT
jgi:hypothetical protein